MKLILTAYIIIIIYVKFKPKLPFHELFSYISIINCTHVNMFACTEMVKLLIPINTRIQEGYNGHMFNCHLQHFGFLVLQ